jgi:hypothetical protein
MHELWLACNNFVRLTFWCVMWLRTRTCGYLVMFYSCDLILLILWIVLVPMVVFEANPSLIFSDIYMWLSPWSLFCRETPPKFIMSMHMCKNQMKIICTYVGEFSLYSCFGDIHSIYLLNLFEKSKWLQNTKPFLHHSFKWLSSITKRGRLKASRPLIRVLVINDNHYGLTFLFEL